MIWRDFLNNLLSWYLILPAALLCILPVKSQLKNGFGKTIRRAVLLALILIMIASVIDTGLQPPYNSLMPFILLPAFFLYQKSCTMHISKTIAIFILVCAFMSFLVNFSIAFDATIHPMGGLESFSLEASIFQAVISTLFALLTAYPLFKYGRVLIDHCQIERVWYMSALVSSIFLIYNIRAVLHNYGTLHTNKVFSFYWFTQCLLFILLLLLCVLFYYIVSGMVETAELKGERNILEMQRIQFLRQQQYLDAVSRERHDFKHTLRILKTLSNNKDLNGINEYLSRYMDSLPENEIRSICKNTAINAVLNYYMDLAEKSDITCYFRIEIPEGLERMETDLCNIFGNILDNAVTACQSVEPKERFIHLTAKTENDYYLYIVETNSFDGNTRKQGENYMSTSHKGLGIGLTSVTSIARHHGGSADFSDSSSEFYSNIMLPLEQ